eukprot:3371269-Prymnesium_polylepis.1
MSKITIQATKKGALPLSLEKRKCGKVVTVITGVRGDADGLLGQLKAALGTGGTVRASDNAIEVQGDRRDVLDAWLRKSGCVKGLS